MRGAWIACVAAVPLVLLQNPAGKLAVPMDPLTAILEAAKTHDIIALGDPHGNEQAHAVRLAILRDPRFAVVVHDIVVECGNARYQDLIDRFMSGEAVPHDQLRHVWQDTTVANAVWDVPIYEEFLQAVRSVNRSLPKARQVRVLLGDPPVDWSTVRGRDDLRKWLVERDSFPAALIRREVLNKKRRALVVYGTMHFQRKDILVNFEPSDATAQLLLMRLEGAGAKVYSIWPETGIDLATLQADIASWSKPRLTVLRGSVLGAADFASYLPTPSPRFRNVVGGPDFASQLPREQWRPLAMQDQFDAVLYLGPLVSLTTARLAHETCTAPGYADMRLQRMMLMGASPNEIGRFKQACGL